MNTLGQWQPIETAPKDGTLVIISNGETCGVARWDIVASRDTLNDIDGIAVFRREYGWRSRSDKVITAKPPTHWMPIPSIPGTERTPAPQLDIAALQAQLDATNEGAWEYERQLNAALKSLQEIADMHVGDQPAAMTGYSEVDWVKRHVGIMRHIASTAVKTIVADEAAKPKPVDLTAELVAALEGIRWMALEWFKYSGSDATCADEYRRDLDLADEALAKAGAQ